MGWKVQDDLAKKKMAGFLHICFLFACRSCEITIIREFSDLAGEFTFKKACTLQYILLRQRSFHEVKNMGTFTDKVNKMCSTYALIVITIPTG
jgi:hypothetical protein